jgi:hypothetical protein
MFIINPYRYAAGQEPITDFFGSIHTSSLSFTLGPVGLQISGSIHTSSVEFTIGHVSLPITSSGLIEYVDLEAAGIPNKDFVSSGLIEYVDLRVT